MIKKAKNTVRWTYVIEVHNVREIVEKFFEKENQTELRIENVIKG